MSTAEGRSRPRLNDAADTKKVRRYFIGGSDARIIMGNDEAALLRLWREKRGEIEPEDLSGNLIVQLAIGALEDAKAYQAFEAIIIADYDAQSAVERETGAAAGQFVMASAPRHNYGNRLIRNSG